jgi:SAM-dependent methyltransferase
MCPRCWSLERQRLFALAISRGEIAIEGRDIIHFAGEISVASLIRARNPASYRVSEYGRDDADLSLNLEAIDLLDASVDTIIANHVLEHVDDGRALAEIFRVLRPGGELVCMVPLVEGWCETYENPAITSPTDCERHFGRTSSPPNGLPPATS